MGRYMEVAVERITSLRRNSRHLSRWILSGTLCLAAASTLVGCADMVTTTKDTNDRGMALYNEGNYSDAAGAFRNAVRQNPRSYQSYYMMGNCYEQLGQHQSAIQVYHTSLDVQKVTLEGQYDTQQRVKTVTALANAIAKSDSRDTETNAAVAKARTSQNSEDYLLLAKIYEYRGDADSAIESYDHAVLLAPQNFDTLKEYGLFLERLGQAQRAENPLRRAYALNASDLQVNDALRRLGIVPGPSLKRQSELNKAPLPKGPIPEVDWSKVGNNGGSSTPTPSRTAPPPAPAPTAQAPRD
jgi:Tfp pilus assembly protein PilF